MKILILAKFLPKDGVTTHIYTISKYFSDNKHDVAVLSGGPPNEKEAIELYNENKKEMEKVKFYNVNFPIYAKYTFKYKIKQLIKYICVIPKAIKLIDEFNPDIIHVHYPVTSYIARIYCSLRKKKFITTYHAKDIPKHLLYKKADKAIAISNDMVTEISENWKYEMKNIELIFNGIRMDKFNKNISSDEKIKFKEKNNIPVDKIIIGFVGSCRWGKGIDILLKASSKIKEKNFHIVIVGDNQNEYFNNILEETQLRENISIFNFQNPVSFYSIFDIFVLPSRSEAFGLVCIEAMIQECCVIRSNTGGAFDMIQNGVNGFIFENENIMELKNILEYTINSDINNIKISAKKTALENFSEEIMCSKILEAYKV